MPTVETVAGPIGTNQLGVTLMHEHIFVVDTELALNYPEGWDEQARVTDAVQRLAEAKAAGVDTIVDLSRVIIGHSGDTTDLDYLDELIAAGSWLGMDRFGVDILLPFEDRVRTVASMCERGHAGRMVLSHDACCFIDWLPAEALAAMPNWHYLHIHRDVLPALRRHGVHDDQIRTMLVDNPRRIFEHGGGY